MLLGIFIGVLARLTLPALYVWKETPDFKWDHKYTKQAVYTLIVAVTASLMGYVEPQSNLTGQQVLREGFLVGVALKETVNQLRKWDTLKVERLVASKLAEEQ